RTSPVEDGGARRARYVPETALKCACHLPSDCTTALPTFLFQVPSLRLRSRCTVWPASEIGCTEPLRPSFAGCVAEKTIFGATFTATGPELAAEECSR